MTRIIRVLSLFRFTHVDAIYDQELERPYFTYQELRRTSLPCLDYIKVAAPSPISTYDFRSCPIRGLKPMTASHDAALVLALVDLLETFNSTLCNFAKAAVLVNARQPRPPSRRQGIRTCVRRNLNTNLLETYVITQTTLVEFTF